MPALFAYLIAVGLLLGGGYGAVSWLAAPEPVKVVAKGKQKPPSTDAQKSASTDAASVSAPASAQVSAPQAGDSGVKPASNDKPQASDKPQSSESARVTTREQGGSNEGANSNPDQPIVAHAETAPAETTQSPAPHAAVVPQRKDEYKQESKQDNRRPAEGASASSTALNGASAAAAKPKRPSQRQASRSPEHRGLALMTLRTIEFPDGRRATMLIPYRGDNRRAMAIDPEW